MKYYIAAIATFFSTSVFAGNFSDLKVCLGALDSKIVGNGSDISYVVQAGMTAKGGAILVVNDVGAINVDSVFFDELNQFATFRVPGEKQMISQGFHPEPDGTFIPGWTSFFPDGKDPYRKESNFKKLSASEAEKLAGVGALAKYKKMKSNSYLKYLDSWLRTAYHSTGSGFGTHDYKGGQINPERLKSELEKNERDTNALNACDKLSDQNIKQAAAIRKTQVAEVREKLIAYRINNTALDDCVAQCVAKLKSDVSPPASKTRTTR